MKWIRDSEDALSESETYLRDPHAHVNHDDLEDRVENCMPRPRFFGQNFN